jgi:uncharacterized membrane protein
VSRKKENTVSVAVHGIEYAAFARLKWQQLLRVCSLIVAVLAVAGIALVATGRITEDVPVTSLLVVVLLVLAMMAIFRSGIRREYRAAGLANVELRYDFDRDGWTVKQGSSQVRVLWANTHRVQRTNQALMLYPNRKSVNLVPLRFMTQAQLDQVLGWVQGKK